jgi:hypothetical protein
MMPYENKEALSKGVELTGKANGQILSLEERRYFW